MLLTLRCQARRALLKSSALVASSRSSPLSTAPNINERVVDDGAWTVLAALEKAKEAQGIQVARLVSSLEALLPRTGYDLDASSVQQQHTNYQQHTSDPAFFSLPDTQSNNKITGDDVLKILQATRRGRRVDLYTIEALVKEATKQFQHSRPRVVSLPPLQENQQLTVIGDLHGSLSDLEAVLGLTGEPSRDNLLLFNGDLADRGDHGMEVIVVVCALYLAYPDYVFVNRGNHEDLALSIAYGLAAEVQHKYGASVFRNKLMPLLDAFFCSLPLATVVEKDALIVHAGPPPPGVMLSDVEKYMCERDKNDSGFSRTIRTHATDSTTKIRQGSEAQDVVEALLWSDPAIDEHEESLADYHGQIQNDEMLGWIPNVSRGAGYKYDSDIVRNLLNAEGLVRLVRSHEPVHQGCARYEIPTTNMSSSSSSNSSSSSKPLEFFTVFSASRYPYKEGFNQGALLKLQPNGEHRVLRYATEEDEPLVGSSFTSFDEGDATSPMCVVDSTSLRRALQEAVASHRSELVDSLGKLADLHSVDDIPFDKVVDLLIRTLKLDESGLKKPSAKMALARALSIQCHDAPPETIDLLGCIDSLTEGDDDEDFVPEMVPYYPWLRAVFELVDLNHDGVLSRSEWLAAVASINSKLPEGAKPINAADTWELLDFNGDGHVSSSEWDELGKALCR